MKAIDAAVLAVICLIGMFGCEGKILRWVPNTDFENPRNWRTGRLPCGNEHVRFPPTTASVFVQRNNTMLEIVLPNDGELVLGQDVSFTFLSAPINDATCTEQDTFYNGSDPASWYDVRSWCEADDNDGCEGNPPSRLHTEGIPCGYDDVVFPFESRFVVDIDSGADIRVNTVRIGQQQLSTSQLRDRINSDLLQRQFVRNSTGGDTAITISGNNRCNDVTGCACNNQQLKDKVCAIETPRCGVPSCDDAVLPLQHCCTVCGAVLKLRYESGFRFGAIEKLLLSIYEPPMSNDVGVVWWIVSKVGSDSETVIQVVIADDGGGENAKAVAYVTKQLLEDDVKENGRLRVTSVTMDVSGSPHPSAHSHTGEVNASSPGIIAVIVIVVIIVVVAVVVAVMCYVWRRQGKRIPRIPMPTLRIPQFVRWRPRGGRGSVGLGDVEMRRGVVFDNRIIFDVSATSFDNLTYGSQPRHGMEQLEVQPGMAAQAGFDNPMYGTGALQASLGVPSAEEAVIPTGPRVSGQPTASRFDSLPLVSKVAGMLRGLRFNVASQKLEETPGDVAGTGSDVNDNEKPELSVPAEADDDVPWTAAGGKGSKKKKGPRKSKKSGRAEQDVEQKHQKMEEEPTDSDEDLTGTTARKLATQMTEKGFGNLCYDVGPIDTQPVTAATTTPASASAAATLTESYRTGFANPMFEETKRPELQDGETGDGQA